MTYNNRNLSIDNWFQCNPKKPLPKTTTEETFNEENIRKTKTGFVTRKLINFQSYTMEALGLEPTQHGTTNQWTSIYQRDYLPPPHFTTKKTLDFKDKEPMELPFLWNRRVRNDFDWDSNMDFKFMDDHLNKISNARKEVNKYRQIRNSSFTFEDIFDNKVCERNETEPSCQEDSCIKK